MKPWIGISGVWDAKEHRYTIANAYIEAVARAGGIPILLPWCHMKEVELQVKRLDGILFTGGADVHPKHYGEACQAQTQPEAERDHLELSLFFAAQAQGMPMLGICRGIQLMAVAMGGSLHQHIEGHSDGIMHPIRFTLPLPTWALSQTMTVNSFHHQAVKSVPLTARVLARADDGTVEAVSFAQDRFCVGVQWHPERMSDPCAVALMQRFLQAASGLDQM